MNKRTLFIIICLISIYFQVDIFPQFINSTKNDSLIEVYDEIFSGEFCNDIIADGDYFYVKSNYCLYKLNKTNFNVEQKFESPYRLNSLQLQNDTLYVMKRGSIIAIDKIMLNQIYEVKSSSVKYSFYVLFNRMILMWDFYCDSDPPLCYDRRSLWMMNEDNSTFYWINSEFNDKSFSGGDDNSENLLFVSGLGYYRIECANQRYTKLESNFIVGLDDVEIVDSTIYIASRNKLYQGTINDSNMNINSIPIIEYEDNKQRIKRIKIRKDILFLTTESSEGTYLMIYKKDNNSCFSVVASWKMENALRSYDMEIYENHILLGTEVGVIILEYSDTINAIKGIKQPPIEFNLLQNYPNPFNPTTTIKYSIPETGFVTIKVYDILGREISVLVNEYKQNGTYEIKFDGSQLSSGVYLYRITSGNFSETRKMILSK